MKIVVRPDQIRARVWVEGVLVVEEAVGREDLPTMGLRHASKVEGAVWWLAVVDDPHEDMDYALAFGNDWSVLKRVRETRDYCCDRLEYLEIGAEPGGCADV